jgi:hypothetical protein
MTLHLIVTKPFLGFVKGDIIAEAGKISEILASDYKKFVIRVASPVALKG